MEDKQRDLIVNKQRQLLNAIVVRLNELNPSFYYLSTSEVAYEIEQYVQQTKELTRDEIELLNGLSRNDIQMILSLHSI